MDLGSLPWPLKTQHFVNSDEPHTGGDSGWTQLEQLFNQEPTRWQAVAAAQLAKPRGVGYPQVREETGLLQSGDGTLRLMGNEDSDCSYSLGQLRRIVVFILLGPKDTYSNRFLWGLCYHVVIIRGQFGKTVPWDNRWTEGTNKRKQGQKVVRDCLHQVVRTEGEKRPLDA